MRGNVIVKQRLREQREGRGVGGKRGEKGKRIVSRFPSRVRNHHTTDMASYNQGHALPSTCVRAHETEKSDRNWTDRR
jgi:hypothetical protein